MEFPVSDSGRVHRDSETGATGLRKPESGCATGSPARDLVHGCGFTAEVDAIGAGGQSHVQPVVHQNLRRRARRGRIRKAAWKAAIRGVARGGDGLRHHLQQRAGGQVFLAHLHPVYARGNGAADALAKRGQRIVKPARGRRYVRSFRGRQLAATGDVAQDGLIRGQRCRRAAGGKRFRRR